MKSKSVFKSNITKKWFTSILAIITAILLFVMMLCFYLIHGMKSSILQMSHDMTTYLQKSVDSSFREVQKNAILFELNSTNIKIKNSETQGVEIDSTTYQFCDLIQNFCVSSTLVDKLYIYYPKIDYVASNVGFFPADFYFKKVNPTAQKPVVSATQLVSKTEIIPSVSNKGKIFSYIQNMIYDNAVVGVLVMEIDPMALFEDAQTIIPTSTQTPSFAILIQDEYYVLAGSDLLFDDIKPQKNTNKTEFSKNGIYIYQQPSFLPDISYVTAFKNSSLFSPIYFAIAICSLGITICLILGILYSTKISKKNTKPIVDLLDQFPENSSHKNDSIDEFIFINQKVNEILSQKQFNEVKLQEQQEVISSLFLKSLINGTMQNQYAIFSVAQNYGIIWENLYYQILLISSENYSEKSFDTLKNLFKSKEIDAIFCEKDSLLVILLNLNDPFDEWDASVFAGEILECFPQNSYCSFGRYYDQLTDVNTSYQEALLSMGNCNSNTRFCFFKKSMRQNSLVQLNGLQSMSTFLNYLHNNHYKEALDILPTVFDDYLDQSVGAEEKQRRMISLQNAVFDEVNKQKINGLKVSKPPKKDLETLLRNSSSSEFQTYIATSISQLIQEQNSTTKEEGSIPYRAKEMINQNFTDPLLGLYMVADNLNVSNTYLSTSFKNTFKVGVVQYINQLRIDQAKELILNTDLTIKEIATQVGFSSDISFIRVFKKYEESTPNNLRKNKES